MLFTLLFQEWQRENLVPQHFGVWRSFVLLEDLGTFVPIDYLPGTIKDKRNYWDCLQNPEIYGVIALFRLNLVALCNDLGGL